MIKVVIVDDQQIFREALKDALQPFRKIKVIAECGSADEAAEVIKKFHPDLVFLDVEMPGKTGVELLNEMNDVSFETIFTTSHPHYAIQALKADALDYLLKPVQPIELAEALHKFSIKKNKENLAGKLHDFIKDQKGRSQPQQKISVPTSNGYEFLKMNDIVRLKSEVNYTTFYLSDKRQITVSRTLKEYEEMLEQYGFVRVHKSHMINLSYLKRYVKGNGGIVYLEDGTELDVSRQRKDQLLAALKQYEK